MLAASKRADSTCQVTQKQLHESLRPGQLQASCQHQVGLKRWACSTCRITNSALRQSGLLSKSIALRYTPARRYLCICLDGLRLLMRGCHRRWVERPLMCCTSSTFKRELPSQTTHLTALEIPFDAPHPIQLLLTAYRQHHRRRSLISTQITATDGGLLLRCAIGRQRLSLWQRQQVQRLYNTEGLRTGHPSRRIYSVLRSESLGDEPAMLHKHRQRPTKSNLSI